MKIQLTIWWCWIIIYIALNSFMYAKELRVMKLVEGIHKPVYLTAPENNSDTLFIVEQHGVVQRLINGEVALSPLLNIRHQVHQPKMPGDERGLLGFALHPQFSKNGRIFVNYVNKKDSTVISEYEVDPKTIIANAKKEKIILKFQQPYSNHNGGQLAFGPDGFLYIAVGDGGYAGDPHENGQNIETIFGTILRIDIDGKPSYEIPVDNPFLNEKRAKGEIWCYGIRNAWRFSFDAETG
ncbi:MAG TPA: glucose dehydrogenase, partial [Candidatus Marinimicrobia bacterium]|nr:glucose dehydrogenase [Candidatus Neomarinimicrobiota bacterium]